MNEENTIIYKKIWYENLTSLNNFISENNKLPSNSDKENKHIIKWLNHQIINYEKHKCEMKDEIIRKIWKEFINENSKYFNLDENSHNQQWYKTLQNLNIYILENNNLPSKFDKDPDIKYLSKWITNNQINYNKRQIYYGR